MDEVTYYPEVRCEVHEVAPPLDRIAELRDVEGRLHQINVPRNLIRRRGSEDFLPVGIVKIDRRKRLALIEFPVESGQGTNRAWVGYGELWHEIEPVAV